jgi:hypothetical protein
MPCCGGFSPSPWTRCRERAALPPPKKRARAHVPLSVPRQESRDAESSLSCRGAITPC